MCLYSKQILPRRATKDIVCYKRMVKLSPTLYVTPYQNFWVYRKDFNRVLHPKGKPIFLHHRNWTDFLYTIVRGGYFHAYPDCNYATQMLAHDETIVKCIIPKGALYWKSAYEMSGTACEIASDRMIFVEELCVQRIYP